MPAQLALLVLRVPKAQAVRRVQQVLPVRWGLRDRKAPMVRLRR